MDGRAAFGVNYGIVNPPGDNVGVGYFGRRTNRTNSFQLALIDRSDTGAGNFDIEFNYDQIQFETGEAPSSGGVDSLGGNSARAGYSNGTGAPGTSFELPGSAVNGAFLDGGSNSLVANSLNSSVPGRYIFTARNGSVTPGSDPTPTPVPAPSSALSTLAFGTLGAGYLLKRKLKKQQAVQFSNSIE